MKLLLILLAVLVVVIAVSVAALQMPGRSHRGTLAPPTEAQQTLAAELRRDVVALASGEPRNVVVPESLHAAAAHIEKAFAEAGLRPSRQTFTVEGVECANIEAEIRGKSNEIVVVGAHYDSVDTGPGADDNASGTAALLALARRLGRDKPQRTIRLVAFVNEEPPHFQTAAMGSYVYAKRSHERGDKIVAMLSIESIGFYTDQPRSQAYPPAARQAVPVHRQLHRLRRQRRLARAREALRRLVPPPREVPVRGGRAPRGHPADRLVRPVVVLALRLARDHGHGHGAVPKPELPHALRHARDTRLRADGARDGGAGGRGAGSRAMTVVRVIEAYYGAGVVLDYDDAESKDDAFRVALMTIARAEGRPVGDLGGACDAALAP